MKKVAGKNTSIGKKMSIKVDVQVDSKTSEKKVAEAIAKSLEQHKKSVLSIGKLKVKTVGRRRPSAAAAGYESKLWEKVTC